MYNVVIAIQICLSVLLSFLVLYSLRIEKYSKKGLRFKRNEKAEVKNVIVVMYIFFLSSFFCHTKFKYRLIVKHKLHDIYEAAVKCRRH